ncbi:SRPBCC family protein [Paenibacillus aestuarii]|uniref:SRPBCC domain-containing protein n=1 Tax=Paenibacillus aestuarii TaxID=516965 RepID=A0ABW0K4U1_9BACL|nr:SRPBCC domain-containing protein [Paenibacillus aestuarii]
MTRQIPVGQTKSAGFQIGVRRSLPVTRQAAWQLLTSPQGRKLWLGEAADMDFVTGEAYATKDGASGAIRVVKPLEQLRLTWQPGEWQKASTIQIRLLPATAGKTTISFHQENLADESCREAMKLRWEQALAAISAVLTGEASI